MQRDKMITDEKKKCATTPYPHWKNSEQTRKYFAQTWNGIRLKPFGIFCKQHSSCIAMIWACVVFVNYSAKSIVLHICNIGKMLIRWFFSRYDVSSITSINSTDLLSFASRCQRYSDGFPIGSHRLELQAVKKVHIYLQNIFARWIELF